MGAISAGRQAVGAVVRNPILIVVTLFLGIIQVPQLFVQFENSTTVVIASGVLTLLFVLLYPFFFGGVIGMGNEAVDGKTRLGTFVSAGRANYVSLFGAFIIMFAIGIVYTIVLLIVGAVGGFAVVSAAGNETGGAAFLGVAAIVLVAFLLFVLLFFSIQFFGQAIVLDNVGAVGGFKRSMGAVRRHKLSTLGYMVVISVIGSVFGVFGAVFGLLGASGASGGSSTLSPVAIVAALVVFVVLSGVIGAFSMTYGVAFYKQIRPSVE